DEEVRAQLVDIADTIQLVPEPVERPHTRQITPLQRRVVDLRVVELAHLRAESDGLAIRRPDRFACAIAQPGELPRLAAIHRNDPDLRLPNSTLTLYRVGWLYTMPRRTQEGDALPIRRPARMAIVRASGEVARWRLRIRRDEPDRATILVAGAIHLLLDIRD